MAIYIVLSWNLLPWLLKQGFFKSRSSSRGRILYVYCNCNHIGWLVILVWHIARLLSCLVRYALMSFAGLPVKQGPSVRHGPSVWNCPSVRQTHKMTLSAAQTWLRCRSLWYISWIYFWTSIGVILLDVFLQSIPVRRLSFGGSHCASAVSAQVFVRV